MSMQVVFRSNHPKPGNGDSEQSVAVFSGHRIHYGNGAYCDLVHPHIEIGGIELHQVDYGRVAIPGGRCMHVSALALWADLKGVRVERLRGYGDE